MIDPYEMFIDHMMLRLHAQLNIIPMDLTNEEIDREIDEILYVQGHYPPHFPVPAIRY